jgi:hypothetical protein
VASQGARLSRLCLTREAARQAESELLQDLKRRAAVETQAAAGPATVKALFEAYAADLEARGKGPDAIARITQAALAVERLMPAWLDTPVSRVEAADVFAFRKARVERSVWALGWRARAQRLRAAGRGAQPTPETAPPMRRSAPGRSRARSTETSASSGRCCDGRARSFTFPLGSSFRRTTPGCAGSAPRRSSWCSRPCRRRSGSWRPSRP